ncbi:uncharacterized protein LOC114260441 [Camellia sinensis]|uniref:uncharacterized protein LOC114260441 n=1 Tax=Camellia sinensis TaxID=4442 RepID=UPI0010363AF2|nr:uncharacterized protein LOC114260441 [Camellia sinensis]
MYIIDQALSSLKSRFEQFQIYEENFGCYSGLWRKKFFKVEINQILSSVNYITRKIEWVSFVIHLNMMDKFDYASFISDFAVKNMRRVMFM